MACVCTAILHSSSNSSSGEVAVERGGRVLSDAHVRKWLGMKDPFKRRRSSSYIPLAHNGRAVATRASLSRRRTEQHTQRQNAAAAAAAGAGWAATKPSSSNTGSSSSSSITISTAAHETHLSSLPLPRSFGSRNNRPTALAHICFNLAHEAQARSEEPHCPVGAKFEAKFDAKFEGVKALFCFGELRRSVRFT